MMTFYTSAYMRNKMIPNVLIDTCDHVSMSAGLFYYKWKNVRLRNMPVKEPLKDLVIVIGMHFAITSNPI